MHMRESDRLAGRTENIELFRGHIGLTVLEGFRDGHRAGRRRLLSRTLTQFL